MQEKQCHFSSQHKILLYVLISLHADHIKKARPAKMNVAAFKPTYAADPVYDADEDEAAADELLDVDLAVLLGLVVVEDEDSELEPLPLEELLLLLDMFPLALALV